MLRRYVHAPQIHPPELSRPMRAVIVHHKMIEFVHKVIDVIRGSRLSRLWRALRATHHHPFLMRSAHQSRCRCVAFAIGSADDERQQQNVLSALYLSPAPKLMLSSARITMCIAMLPNVAPALHSMQHHHPNSQALMLKVCARFRSLLLYVCCTCVFDSHPCRRSSVGGS